MSKLVAKIFSIAIGLIVFLFGLLLLGTSVLAALKLHNDIDLSLEGSMVAVGILFLFFAGFYFMWISYSILILKRITSTSMLILTGITSLFITITFCEFIQYLWNKPEKGYSFLPKIVLAVLYITVFVISYFVITKILMNIFRRGNDIISHR